MGKGLFFAILFISFIAVVSSQSVLFSCPEKVSLGEEFSVFLSLDNFSEGSYDIKIDIMDSAGERVAKIFYEEEWKSTYYYLQDAIDPSSKESFKLKIVKEFDVADITVKVRDSKGNINSFGGYSLNFSSVSEEDNASEEDKGDSLSEDNLTIVEGETPLSDEGYGDESLSMNTSTEDIRGGTNSEVIFLTSESGEKEKESSKTLNNELNSSYYLAGFSLLLCFLLVLKFARRKRKNEFRD